MFPQRRPGNGVALRCRIVAAAAAMPEQVVTNEDIINKYHHRVADTAIRKMLGISERRVAANGVVDSDLLSAAASACLNRAGFRADQLSKLIVTRFMGDRLLPMTASHVQQKLQCKTPIQAFDIVGGIHSFMEALHTAACAVEADNAPVLVVSGGIVNRLVSRTDPRSAFLFGDGAAAVLLAPSDSGNFLSAYSFSNYDFIESAVAFRLRDYGTEALYESEHNESLFDLYQQEDWKRSKDFVLEAMGLTAQTLLLEAKKKMGDVDLFLVTENHHRLHQAIVERLEIPQSKTLSVISKYGNTMSAMLPLMLNEAMESGKAGPGSLVMMLSIGEGIKGGGILLNL
jgi:3-oxoacyl-[acyl-carrier-protein] synthase-3